MANDRSKGPSWKNPSNEAPAHGSRKQWQPDGKKGDKAPPDQKARFRKRVLGAGATGALLVALFIIVFEFVGCYKPPGLTLTAPDANTTLCGAANVYGWNSAQDLEKWAKDKEKDEHDRPKLLPQDNWKAAFNSNEKEVQNDSSKSIILYFAAHGAADRNGPYLWLTLNNATTIDNAQKLPVRDILAELKRKPELRKLVIFDATQITSSWAHGYLHNDFARALKEIDKEIKEVKNLVVICSSSEDQRSWVSEEWQRSIFGHFLIEGLRGGAGQKEPRIKVLQLFEYLEKEVNQWVRANRDAEQTPFLLPSETGKELAEKLEITTVTPSDWRKPDAAKAPGNDFTVPADLKAAWETAAELGDPSKHSPPPETANPSKWREYLDTLLRWEYLARAGSNTTGIQGQTERLAQELRKPLFDADPLCLANSLAEAPALGIEPEELKAKKFEEIWTIPTDPKDPKPEDIWRELRQKKTRDNGPTLLRLQAAQLVLDKVLADPSRATLKRAKEVLQIIDGVDVRPIETHYLLMLERDLPDNYNPALVRKALNLRIKAERVSWLGRVGADGKTSHPDQVYRWIERPLLEADHDRRRGEDLLFADDAESWKRAEEFFTKADQQYQQCARDAAIVARALRLRDSVFARLPYYARWAAGYRGTTMTPLDLGRLLERIKSSAALAHDLAGKLEEVPENPSDRLQKIDATARQLEGDFDALKTDFDKDILSLGTTYLPSNWHAIDHALTVPSPLLPVARRLDLLLLLHKISQKLNTTDRNEVSPTSTTPPEPKELAQRQGRMALAVLGQRWIDESRRNLLQFGELDKSIREPNRDWWVSLREAGQQIGGHFQDMVPAIRSNLNDADQKVLKEAPRHLAQASYLARLLDSATPSDRSPGAEERRFWAHRLFLWQARRTADDGWASLTPVVGARPYCEEAGLNYAKAAERLILGESAKSLLASDLERRRFDVDETRKLLKAPTLTVTFPPEQNLLTNLSFSIDYAFKAQPPRRVADIDYPVMILDSMEPLRTEKLPSQRLPIEFATYPGRRLSYTLDKQAGSAVSTQTKVRLLYRGHNYPMNTPVFQNRPNIEWVYTPPKGDAHFAIISRQPPEGAVAIILDRTISMGDPTETGEIKIEAARNALDKVLKDDVLPDGTLLSIGFFHGDRNRNLKMSWLTKDGPIRWGQAQAMPKNVIRKQIKGVEVADDGHSTPLARMLERVIANEDGMAFPKDWTGFRSIVVLTDGDDNVDNAPAPAPATSKPGERVVKALNNPDYPEVALHMIFFGLNQAERARADTQFKAIAEPTNFDRERTPGTISLNTQSTAVLLTLLNDSMMPKVRVIQRGGGYRNRLSISRPADGFRNVAGPLKEGTYDLRAPDIFKQLHLEPGDRVLLEMSGKNLRIPYYSDLLGLNTVNVRADSANGSVRLILRKNSLTDKGSRNDLQLLATLERPTQQQVEDLSIIRPEFAWFDVSPLDGAGDYRSSYVKIENVQEQVAPTWTIDVAGWVPRQGETSAWFNPARPRLDAYWVGHHPGQERVTIQRLENAEETNERFKGKKIRVGDSNVEIKSIVLNRKNEGFELEVEVEHEKDKPIVVRAERLKNVNRLELAETHRWYHSANRYVVVFGRINNDDLKKEVDLQFHTLRSVRDNANVLRLEAQAPGHSNNTQDLLEGVRLEKK